MYFDYREDTELSPDLQLLKENAHRFAVETVRPASVAIDRLRDPQDAISKDTLFWTVLRESYRRHYHAATLPREVNGQGLPGLGLQPLFEEIGWGDAGLAFTLRVPFRFLRRP